MEGGAETPDEGAGKKAGQPGAEIADLLSKALGAVAGGLSLAGLIVAVGGAVMWVRLEAAGVPTAPPLALIAKEELTAIGLASLIPFVGMALLVVLLLYVIDPHAEVKTTGGPPPATSPPVHPQAPPRTDGDEEPRYQELGKSFRIAAKNTAGRAGLLVGLEMVLLFVIVWGWPGWLLVGLALLTALAGAVISFGVAAQTENRFAWFAVVAFFSVVLFGAVVSFVRSAQHPKLQPAAVLKHDGRAITGLYIAQTTDRVYLARLRPDQRLHRRHKAARHKPLGPTRCFVPRNDVDLDLTGVKGKERSGRVFSVDQDRITAISIGELQSICSALQQAPQLARELKADYPR
jgi:hypothetical protein